MGTVELWIVIAFQAAVIARFYSDYRAMRFLAEARGDKIKDLEAEIKGFKAQGVLAKPAVYHDKAEPKKLPVYNGSIARRMMERRNAEFFSADKKIPNSEIVKENANG